MSLSIKDYTPRHDYLLCIDSDGCVLDAMKIKHLRCHGPCFIKEWGLEERSGEIMKLWCDVNLHSPMRGVNRFYALIEILRRLDMTEDLEALETWVKSAKKLSTKALETELQSNPAPILRKAYNWSQAVNEAIEQIPTADKPPFENAAQAMANTKDFADLAIVTSSNIDAVLTEWGAYDLLEHISVIAAQENGGKADCIRKLLEKGFLKERVLVVGDAPGDMAAAEQNEVLFYPIIPGREPSCWQELVDEGLPRLMCGSYGGEYQNEKSTAFENALSSE